jgi:ribonuclease D
MADHTLPKPQLIETNPELLKAISQLRTQPRIAVDTESNSLFAYREQVCLIQMSTVETDYLIDSLRISDLEPLNGILESSEIEKVFHAAEYDLICLKRDFGFKISNIFDTRVAMRTLGIARTGLGNVLKDQFGVKVNKKWQRADWGQRPLPVELLDYARLDTHYLLPLRDRLADKLEEENRWFEAQEEWDRLSMIQPSMNDFDPDRFWKINGARQLKPDQAAVLRELFHFREDHARALNRPPFKVIGDQTLLDIAREMPASEDTLADLAGMTSGQMRRYGKGLIEAIDLGRGAEPPSRPKTERLKEPVASRYKKLHTWRKRKAEKRRVESDVILPREIVWEISHRNPQNLNELELLMKPLGWRFREYGEEILQLLKT